MDGEFDGRGEGGLMLLFCFDEAVEAIHGDYSCGRCLATNGKRLCHVTVAHTRSQGLIGRGEYFLTETHIFTYFAMGDTSFVPSSLAMN